MYKLILRPFLFLFAPEKAHHLTFSLLKWSCRIPFANQIFRLLFKIEKDDLSQQLFGLTFPNPVGLAAGLDKNALVIDEMSNFGFGFIEIGTVTPIAQDGNPQPRLFRVPIDHALINRMGFNNDGMELIKKRLIARKSNVLIGGNIGKNKVTANENAYQDYLNCFECLYDVVDYFVVNVSSPNTPGLRALQEKEPLTDLLLKLHQLNKQKPKLKPILLKIAPDLNESELDDIAEIAKEANLSGIIATNTTISRANLKTDSVVVENIGLGGLSGLPVRHKSTAVIRYLRSKTN
jgi:dihydroorotate dehydrogenase